MMDLDKVQHPTAAELPDTLSSYLTTGYWSRGSREVEAL